VPLASGFDPCAFRACGFFPSIGAVNLALTVMANAIRVGEHLRQRMT